MTNVSAVTESEPSLRGVVWFFIAAYAFAWVLWGYWIPAMPPGGLQITPAFLLCAIGGGFGPSLAGIVVLAATRGWGAVGDLFRSVFRVSFAPVWFAVTLLLVPAVTVVSVVIQTLVFGPPAWGGAGLVPLAIVWPVMAALGEEFGWRGYALPRLIARFGLVAACFIVGIVWGFWHLPADYIALKAYGWWFVPAFIANGPIILTAHAVIMGWIWARSGGSLLLMLIYHFTVTSMAIAAPVAATDPAPATGIALLNAGLFSLVAAALVLFRRSDFRVMRLTPP